MRTERKVVALVLALALAGCGKGQERTAGRSSGMKRDLATAANKNLDLAPKAYTRMRFVSDIERSKAGVAMKPVNAPRHVDRLIQLSAKTIARDPIASMASRQLATISTLAAAAPSPTVVVAPLPAAEPPRATPTLAFDGNVIDHAGEHTSRGIFDGMAGHVVIRGGRGENDKCDPRSEAQARGELAGRPDSRMPLVPSSSVFGGMRH